MIKCKGISEHREVTMKKCALTNNDFRVSHAEKCSKEQSKTPRGKKFIRSRTRRLGYCARSGRLDSVPKHASRLCQIVA